MSLESIGTKINEWQSLKKSPEYLQKLDERVDKIEKDEKNYKQLVKVNDVLNVLDYPDNQEDKFRKILEQQNPETLKELATNSKEQIIIYLINENKKNKYQENEEKEIKQESIREEYKGTDKKFSEIKNILPKWVYSWNPKFDVLVQNLNKFKWLENWIDKNKIKSEILDTIIAELKENLKFIVANLGWANKEDPTPEYLEFKNTLIWMDSSFKLEFDILENKDIWSRLNTNEVINSIQKDSWWITSIDLNSDTPISKMSLVWSNYSFETNIDKQAISEVQEKSINKIKGIENSFTVLKGVNTPFNKLINNIKQNWGKENLQETINNSISSFSSELFSNLWDMYEEMGIKPNTQLTETDINSFRNIKSPDDLRSKIENVQNKLHAIKTQILEKKDIAKSDYELELKELVKIEEQQEKWQLKTLEFMSDSWFDLLPKEITNKLIWLLQSNSLTIPWLDLNVKNIDLKNWNFWESDIFSNNENWLNANAKRNMLKFMNKLISWNIDEPLNVEAIVNWTIVADPAFLKSEFIKNDLVSNIWWKFNTITNNLKNSFEK